MADLVLSVAYGSVANSSVLSTRPRRTPGRPLWVFLSLRASKPAWFTPLGFSPGLRDFRRGLRLPCGFACRSCSLLTGSSLLPFPSLPLFLFASLFDCHFIFPFPLLISFGFLRLFGQIFATLKSISFALCFDPMCYFHFPSHHPPGIVIKQKMDLAGRHCTQCLFGP